MGAALSSSAADRSPVISTSDRPQPGPVGADDTPAPTHPGETFPGPIPAPSKRADLVKRTLLDEDEDRRTITATGLGQALDTEGCHYERVDE